VNPAITSTTWISGAQALAAFRQSLSGSHALDLLQQAKGCLLVGLPVGVGKSEWLIRTILEAHTSLSPYELVIVLVPQWDILRELIQRLPPHLPRTILYPRPRRRCGALDAPWKDYESAGCGILGKEILCRQCPKRAGCTWPTQYGKYLAGAQLILATQQHLQLNPWFIADLCCRIGAKRSLVLLDESSFVAQNVERALSVMDLQRFLAVQQAAVNELEGLSGPTKWLHRTQLLTQATTDDLRNDPWQFPAVNHKWALQIQQQGWHLYGKDFRFLGHELYHFKHGDAASRERLTNGDIRFACPPYLGPECIIFSGAGSKELIRYRLDPSHRRPPLVSPFEHLRFQHPETRWYNLNLLDGAAKFFPKNADRILAFFAVKIVRNMKAGKRTLLVARKKFIPLCRTRLRQLLSQLDTVPFTIVTGNWRAHDFSDPHVLPLINYGIAGINRFEHSDAVYCLTSYYISPATLSRSVFEIEPTTDHVPITIKYVGHPRQRRALVHLPDRRPSILRCLAQGMLEHKEADVVVQAAGRVRPFTRPREVVTFHAGNLPGVQYTRQFQSLAEAAHFFGVVTPAKTQRVERIEQARQFRAQGRSIRQIADQIGVSPSTVKRYLQQ
jgi:hypothetical protein